MLKIVNTGLRISIHALHEESDCDNATKYGAVRISIHALHEESDASMEAFASGE